MSICFLGPCRNNALLGIVSRLCAGKRLPRRKLPVRLFLTSCPADLPSLVLLLEPVEQGGEVGHHGSGGEGFAGRFFEDGVPISGGTEFEDSSEELADFEVA